MGVYHVPILLTQAIEGLAIKEGGVYVDMTFGSGGYTKAILQAASNVTVVAFDCDKDALQNAIQDKRLHLFHSNYRFFNHFLDFLNISGIDGLVADLGVSSHQFDTAERGFSFRFDTELDLRMNVEAKLTAKQVVKEYSKEQLTEIFRNYGELYEASRIAQAIISNREAHAIETTQQLADALKPLIPRGKEHKFLAKVFQALRIEVNDELNALREMLEKSLMYLKPCARVSIVTYHSLEDSMVKNFFKSGNVEGKISYDVKGNPINIPFKMINKKPIVPSDEEIEANNRARSAKLRIAERL